MDLRLNDIVEMKKPHPCGEKLWLVTRVGMDIKLKCRRCGHEVMLPRQGGKGHQENRRKGGTP